MKTMVMCRCDPCSSSEARLMKMTTVCQCGRHACGAKLMKMCAGASTWVDVGVVPDVWPGGSRDPNSEYARIGSEASAARRPPDVEQRRVVHDHALLRPLVSEMRTEQIHVVNN
jgi:hypothetical protein